MNIKPIENVSSLLANQNFNKNEKIQKQKDRKVEKTEPSNKSNNKNT